MIDSLDIAEVVRRTGLSSRTLRFYEARGLVAPLRTASGRRIFGPVELARLHQIIILKAAGLTLAQIAQLFSGNAIDLGHMLRTQLTQLEEDKAQIEHAQSVIHFALSRLDEGAVVESTTLCALIESADKRMKQEPAEWQAVTKRYFTPEQRAAWVVSLEGANEDFDHDAYQAQWDILGAAIAAALPLSPQSEAAQGFVDQWFALLKPYTKAATPELWSATFAMYDDMENWPQVGGRKAEPGFDKNVWDFMKLATAARYAQGGSIEGMKL